AHGFDSRSAVLPPGCSLRSTSLRQDSPLLRLQARRTCSSRRRPAGRHREPRGAIRIFRVRGRSRTSAACPSSAVRAAGPLADGPPAPPCDLSKAFLTEDEFKARVAAANGRGNRYAEAIKSGNFGAAFQAGVTDPTTPQRQTSLIVDPPIGRLPEMTEEGKRRSSLMHSSWEAYPGEVLTFDSELDFDTWDRCITRGMPASMFPFRYNNGVQIIQAPGYVILNMEMIHEARIVPINGPAAPSSKLKQWLGVSRGHWEGTTLV